MKNAIEQLRQKIVEKITKAPEKAAHLLSDWAKRPSKSSESKKAQQNTAAPANPVRKKAA